jgi:exosome complex RNA-binding protein Csl4
MKLVKTLFSTGILLMAATQVQAQVKDSKKADDPVKCTNLKEGQFLNANYPQEIWNMTIKNNIQTEYFNNGKDYIKSTLVFLDDCNYKTIVMEKSDKNDPIKIGDIFNSTIVSTQDNLIKVTTKTDGSQFEVVYIKVK